MPEWRVQVTRTARKSLERADGKTRRRLRDAIDNLMQGDIKKLHGRENQYRLRVGPYRVIFTPDYHNRTLTILEIFLRGQDY